MKAKGRGLLFLCVLPVAAWLDGCADLKAEKAAPAAKPAVAAVAQPTPPPRPTLDPRDERRLSKELVQAAAEYYRLLQEKNVEQASGYADPAGRESLQDELWTFVARYKLESADTMGYELSSRGDVVVGKVKMLLTLFEKSSVVPQKTEQWMTWEHRDNRWVLLSAPKR